jgi:hypothetical protein
MWPERGRERQTNDKNQNGRGMVQSVFFTMKERERRRQYGLVSREAGSKRDGPVLITKFCKNAQVNANHGKSYRQQRDKVEVKDEEQVNETTAQVNKTLLFLAL